MERALQAIRAELQAGYNHSFVLVQNIRDHVWEPNDPMPFSFPVALCRRLSRPQPDGLGLVVAYYALSQGATLYVNGGSGRGTQAEDLFRQRTGLGELLDAEMAYPDEAARRMQEPYQVLARFTPMLVTDDDAQPPFCLLIDSADNLVGHGDTRALSDRITTELLEHWSWDSRIRAKGNCIILLCADRSGIPPGVVRVDDGYRVLDVAYPNCQERRLFALSRGVSEDRATLLSNLTTGFRRADLDETIRRQFDERQIAAKKAEIIRNRCGDALELVESKHGLDQSNAQPYARSYLLEVRERILRDRNDPLIPTGLLFVGVPGNGKSHLTRAFAHDCGMNTIKFKNLRSMWVGESERNLNTALDLLPAVAPCVVFVDEIDQMIHARQGGGGGSDNSGIESRLLGRLLDFMGDTEHRGEILWIGATNRPDLLDPALPRRFDRIIPFMNPPQQARVGLIRDLAARLALPFDGSFDYEQAAALMKDYSCDDVAKVVLRSHETARGADHISNDHVAITCRAFKHNYDPNMYEFTALLAVQTCLFFCDLPWCDQEGSVIDDVEVPWFLERMVINNRIDIQRLTDRLDALRGSLAGRVG